ncbi:MAG: hypothetical protein E6G10_26060 [Actinobacteria bacterium]|nr:MAG: hypothetical protein E6G10_26060 [Actinomycetota bacterium]
MNETVKVACVQAEPVVLDRAGTLDKLEHVTREAADAGARLVVFPETFVPAYPSSTWAKAFAGWADPRAKAAFALLARESLAVPGPDCDRLGRIAHENAVWLVTGVNEVDPERPGTIYNSLLYHAPDGSLALHHRKLVPTNHERLVWGQGDGRGLRAIQTDLGRSALRVGRRDLRRVDGGRRRRMAGDARPHRAGVARVRRGARALPARLGLSGRLPAAGRARRCRRDRPRRQCDPRARRRLSRRAAVRPGGDPLRGARAGAAVRGAAALRPRRALSPAGRTGTDRQDAVR